ncbi:MAG: hypothetical protein AAGM67_12310 [Bacteroidota bacterium]
MKDKNVLGGGNSNFLYNPMSETEQEVIQRLIDSKDLRVNIVGWGHIDHVNASFGDLRLQIPITLPFTAPLVHIPLYYLDLQLTQRDGNVLFSSRYSTLQNGQPIMVGAGFVLDMVWDIAIEKISEKLVKKVKPGARGLTTRVGNMQMDTELSQIYHAMRKGEEKVRKDSNKDAASATHKQKTETTMS